MIAACPKCNARYRVDPQRLGADGARLKCAKCTAVFRVRPPAPDAAPHPAPPLATPSPRPEPSAPVSSAAVAATAPAPTTQPATAQPTRQAIQPEFAASDQSDFESERLVLVADPEEESGKRTIAAIHDWGLQAVLVHDGVEAMLMVQRLLPRALVLDAALPKMYGFQVCEVVKRNESLRDMTVVLVGAIHHRERYRRPPSQLYGADVYLERPDLPDGLKPILVQVGLPVDGRPAVPGLRASTDPALETPAPATRFSSVPAPVATTAVAAPAMTEVTAPATTEVAAPATTEVAAPATTEVAAAASTSAEPDDGLGAEREKAERLARIIVSDIVLYNADKFDAAAASGNVVEALGGDLSEGRALFEQRIDPRIREERDHLVEELRRVAAKRGE